MDLNELLVFTRVVQAGSFVAAARDLDMPKSTVSRKVSALEQRLGARLLQRSTRRLSLTDVGRAYFQHAERVVAEAEEAELAVTRLQDAPRGLLRVTTPLNFGYLGPLVSEFLARYPEVRIELVATDRVVNLVEEGFDVAVRAGELADSTLVARRLATMDSVVVASPAFLRANERPSEPADLERLDCVVFGSGADPATWRLVRDGGSVTVRVRARLIANDFEMLEDAARAGQGVAILPLSRCSEGLRTGTLERVLPAWSSPPAPLHAVYPSARHLSPKVKAFVDHLRDRMASSPVAGEV